MVRSERLADPQVGQTASTAGTNFRLLAASAAAGGACCWAVSQSPVLADQAENDVQQLHEEEVARLSKLYVSELLTDPSLYVTWVSLSPYSHRAAHEI